MNQINSHVENNEVSLREIVLKILRWLKFLWIKKWLLLIFMVLGGLIGFVYALLKKPVYTGATTFVLEDGEQGGGISQYAGMAAMVGIDLGDSGGGLFQGDNIIELYKSRRMLQKALLSEAVFNGKKQLLIDRYINYKDLRKKWHKRPELANISFADSAKFNILQDSIIGEIVTDINKNILSVSKPDKKLSILRVEVKCEDEQFAKRFNDKVVSTVNSFYVATKTKKSLQNVKILQEQTDSVRNVMNGAIYSSVSTVDATPNINPARQILRAPAQKSQFNAETNKAMLTELVKNLELTKMALRKETPLIQIIDEPIFPLKKENFGKLKGIVLGAFIALVISIALLTVRRFYTSVMNG